MKKLIFCSVLCFLVSVCMFFSTVNAEEIEVIEGLLKPLYFERIAIGGEALSYHPLIMNGGTEIKLDIQTSYLNESDLVNKMVKVTGYWKTWNGTERFDRYFKSTNIEVLKETKTYTYNFYPGWNLVGFPFIKYNYTADNFIKDAAEQGCVINAVVSISNGKYLYHPSEIPHNIVPCKAYWVYCDNKLTDLIPQIGYFPVQLSGNELTPSVTINLERGLNGISIPHLPASERIPIEPIPVTGRNILDDINAQGGSAVEVWIWDASLQEWQSVGLVENPIQLSSINNCAPLDGISSINETTGMFIKCNENSFYAMEKDQDTISPETEGPTLPELPNL